MGVSDPEKVYIVNIHTHVVSGFNPRSVTRIDSLETAKLVVEESGGLLKASHEPLLVLNPEDPQYLKF